MKEGGTIFCWLVSFGTVCFGIGTLLENFNGFGGIGGSPELTNIILGVIGMLLLNPPSEDSRTAMNL